MNKEEKKFIERIEDIFYENKGKGIEHFQKVTLYEEGITDILKLLNFVEKQEKELEQKSETLDKVTDKLKEIIKKERELMPYLPHKSASFHYSNSREVLAKEILNIIEERQYCCNCGVELNSENKALDNMCNECKYGLEY